MCSHIIHHCIIIRILAFKLLHHTFVSVFEQRTRLKHLSALTYLLELVDKVRRVELSLLI